VPRSSELPPGTRVLQVGDSFADALGKELGKLLKQAGLRTLLETKTPSYIGDWAYGPVLPKALSRFDPDLVLVTLGANELEIPEPAQRVVPIQRLVKLLGDRPCVWILPPLWKQDTGLIQVIKDNAKPCQVLDSSALVEGLPRGRDHIHPSTEGRLIWATAVLDWLKQARDPAGARPWSLRGSPP
jgi:lysophospholipase L1-like esterase